MSQLRFKTLFLALSLIIVDAGLTVIGIGTARNALAAPPPVAKFTAPASVCLDAKPAPTSALITYNGGAYPITVPIEQILPNCIRLNYGGNALWTTANAAGGVGCVGNTVQVDYTAANMAFNGMHIRASMPAQCAPPQPAPPGPPPVATGSTIKIYYGKTIDMAIVPLVSASAQCYQVDYSGNKMWFPPSALGYRTEFAGNPVGLDYNARRSTPCGVTPPPIPPVAVATAPASVCLGLKPAPTSALITYNGGAYPVTVAIDQILPKCVRLNYGGKALWTQANVAGGVICVGNMVQVDYTAANSAFNGVRSASPPAACL